MARLFGFISVWLMLVISAVAQTGESGWPQRAIRLIVPFPAGSSTDIVARIGAQKLGLGLGQQSSSRIAWAQAAISAPRLWPELFPTATPSASLPRAPMRLQPVSARLCRLF